MTDATAAGPRRARLRPRTHAALLLASLALLVATLGIPRRIESQEALRSVPLGYPFPIAVQDQSRLTPPTFPRRQALLSPWSHPVRLEVAGTALSWACILAALELAAAGIARRRAKSA